MVLISLNVVKTRVRRNVYFARHSVIVLPVRDVCRPSVPNVETNFRFRAKPTKVLVFFVHFERNDKAIEGQHGFIPLFSSLPVRTQNNYNT